MPLDRHTFMRPTPREINQLKRRQDTAALLAILAEPSRQTSVRSRHLAASALFDKSNEREDSEPLVELLPACKNHRTCGANSFGGCGAWALSRRSSAWLRKTAIGVVSDRRLGMPDREPQFADGRDLLRRLRADTASRQPDSDAST